MYTITTISQSALGSTTTTTLAEAAFIQLAWRKNHPAFANEVVVFDKYDYLVSRKELDRGLAITKNHLESQLAYFAE